jgi:tetratricopeptide (TPR) repeat protein
MSQGGVPTLPESKMMGRSERQEGPTAEPVCHCAQRSAGSPMHLLRQIRLVFLTSLFLATAFAQTTDEFRAIRTALRDKAFTRALELVRPALQRSPADPRLWAMQGTAYAGSGNPQEALDSFHRALKIAPDYLPALQGASQIGYDRADAAAIPLLERILHLHPGDVTAHGMLAVLEYQQGNCPAAAANFESAAPLFASRPPALHAWAACLARLQRYDKAVSVLQQCLSLHPDDRHERQILASVEMMAQHPQEAQTVLAPLLGNNPDSLTLELASDAYERAHETDKAVDTLRQAILLDPQNVNLYVEFAALAATHLSFQVGIGVINDGIGLQPKAAPLYFARGMLYVQLGDYNKAQSDFETAYSLDPTQSLTVAAQGLAAVQQNDLAGALAAVQQQLARTPDDPILLYVQADVLSHQGADPVTPEFQTALHSAERAVDLRPTLAPARSVLAKLYLQAGRYQDAALQCRKALEIDPTDQTAVYRLIQALRNTDEKSEIPDLLKRLAGLRAQATQNQREQYRYALVDEAAQPR